jgi:Rps23 Pro-64 3,4-dihydroxylase Tpa1-like proline 4-hydroxylase
MGAKVPVLTLHDAGGYRHFDEGECATAGALLHDGYVTAQPFPHVVIDDFLDPVVLRDIATHYPSRDGKSFFDRAQERLKYQYHAGETTHAGTRNLLAELNSRAFLRFLRNLTGIRGLVSDPYYEGGGLHETRSGGHLSVHADFNIHGKMKLERRLNLLIYLNEDWPADYGGNLELWDKAMVAPVKKIEPLLGRAVIFNTSLDSYHGVPDALTCPPDRSRQSIATYYYTAFEGGAPVPQRNTNFRTRPGSPDTPDRSVGFEHFVNDWVPHRLQRLAMRLNPWKS